MKFFLFYLLLLLLGVIGQAQAEPLKLRRGVAIHEWLNWSPPNKEPTDQIPGPAAEPQAASPYSWPPYRKTPDPITREDLLRIREQGFDFVRLSVDPGPLLSAGDQIRAEALTILGEAVRQTLGADLRVVFDFHPVNQVPAFSSAAIEAQADQDLGERYARVLAETAAMLAALAPDARQRVALELMNEPQFYPCDGGGGRRWQKTLERFVKAARAGSADLTLVVTGACGGNIKGLVNIDPGRLSDPNLLYSFHYYEDHTFTHQGAKIRRWLMSVPWPPSRDALERVLALSRERIDLDPTLSGAERAAARREMGSYLENYFDRDKGYATLEGAFAKLLQWSKRHSIPPSQLFLGEFGVVMRTEHSPGADTEDRRRWLSAVRAQAEKHAIAWSYWEYNNPHGMSLTTSTRTRAFDPVALEALGLTRIGVQRSLR